MKSSAILIALATLIAIGAAADSTTTGPVKPSAAAEVKPKPTVEELQKQLDGAKDAIEVLSYRVQEAVAQRNEALDQVLVLRAELARMKAQKAK